MENIRNTLLIIQNEFVIFWQDVKEVVQEFIDEINSDDDDFDDTAGMAVA